MILKMIKRVRVEANCLSLIQSKVILSSTDLQSFLQLIQLARMYVSFVQAKQSMDLCGPISVRLLTKLQHKSRVSQASPVSQASAVSQASQACPVSQASPVSPERVRKEKAE